MTFHFVRNGGTYYLKLLPVLKYSRMVPRASTCTVEPLQTHVRYSMRTEAVASVDVQSYGTSCTVEPHMHTLGTRQELKHAHPPLL